MRRRRGFTLIELLVVIAIIALLVSILMPSLTMAKHLAYQAACLSNQHNVGSAMAIYESESGYWTVGYRVYSSAPADYGIWMYTLIGGRYVADNQLLICPGMAAKARPPILTAQMLGSPPYNNNHWSDCGYGVAFGNGGTSYPSTYWESEPFRVDRYVSTRSSEAYLYDAANYPAWRAYTYDEFIAMMPSGGFGDPADFAYGSSIVSTPYTNGAGKWQFLSIRHGFSLNCLFFDGHSGKVNGKQFWNSNWKAADCIWDGY